MSARAVCEVPFCKNSSGRFAGQEYLCSAHWRLVPKGLKRRRAELARLLAKRGELEYGRGHYLLHSKRALRLFDAVWKRMKLAAIERAAGL